MTYVCPLLCLSGLHLCGVIGKQTQITSYRSLYSGSLRAIYSVKQCLHLCVCTRVELRRRRRKNVVAVTLSEGFLVVLWSDNYISYTLYNG